MSQVLPVVTKNSTSCLSASRKHQINRQAVELPIFGRLTAVDVLLGSVEIYVRRVRKTRKVPNGLGDPTPTAPGACRNFIESKLPLNRRGGVAPPSFNTEMVDLPDLNM